MADEKNKTLKKKRHIITPGVIGMSLSQSVQVHGEATSQMLQAYKGIRVDSHGNDLHHVGRNLRDISKYKTGKIPSQIDKILKSQAGFSGELIKEARDNKAAILSGQSTRTRTTDGIGQTNNPIFDHVKVDEFGNIIEGSGSQMKIYKIGSSKKFGTTYDVIDKLAKDSKWKKYDCPIDVPSDQYEGAAQYARKRAADYRKQAKACRKNGDTNLASQYDSMAAQYDNAGEKIRKSNLTTKEAIDARINPNKFVSKELCKDMHNAGKQAAIGTAMMSGVIFTLQNAQQVFTTEKDIKEAAKDTVTGTAKSAVYSYGIESAGVAAKAVMHSSTNDMVRRIGKTNAATTIITSTISMGYILKSYASGEIDEVEVLESLGVEGTSVLAAGFGAAIGAVGGPAGAFIGATLANTVSRSIYDNSVQILREEKISAERRAVIEAMCQTAIEELGVFQQEVEAYISQRNEYRKERYDMLFEDVQSTLMSGNINSFIQSINAFGQEFHVALDFESFEEFDQFMSDDSTVFIL